MNDTEIICVFNQKGGVAKTVTSVNLAYHLSETKKVLLIDCDPQGNSSTLMGIDKDTLEADLYDLLRIVFDESYDGDWFKCVYETDFTNLFICPATERLSNFEIAASSTYRREFILEDVLKKFKNEFDYIILDCPPNLGMLTVNALTACNNVIIPTTATVLGISGLDQLLATYNLVKTKLNKNIGILGILITIFSSRDNLSKGISKELEEQFKDVIFSTKIRKTVKVEYANDNNKPVLLYDDKCNASIDYRSFAREVIERLKKE